jgi:hypothetical protein
MDLIFFYIIIKYNIKMSKQFNFNSKKGVISNSSISSFTLNLPLQNNEIIVYQNNTNNWLNTGSENFINNLNINDGPQGSQGEINSDGYTGFQGIIGPNNINGFQGETGFQGLDGPSVESNLRTGINYSNIVIATGPNTTTYFSNGNSKLSIGNDAGFINQNDFSIALGTSAGYFNQGTGSIAIGIVSGQSNQKENAISIGMFAGRINQGKSSICIGSNAGISNVEESTISIGTNSSLSGSYFNSISIGLNAGCSTGYNSICIGTRAGLINSSNSIILGTSNGRNGNFNNPHSIIIGSISGSRTRATGAISIGINSMDTQHEGAIAIGSLSRSSHTGTFIHSVAIGSSAGIGSDSNSLNGNYSVLIGRNAGARDNDNNVNIGFVAGGNTNQLKGSNSIAIGLVAAQVSQQNFSIAIGTSAGNTSQGNGAIAIGYSAGQTSQSSNSIVFNGNISVLINPATTGFFVGGNIQNVSAGTSNGMAYDPITKEIFYDSTKTFVIDHPLDENKYLVHACLEGPEAGVYYRGKGEILENEEYTEIELPEYVEKLASDFTIQITPIGNIPSFIYSSEIENNKFKVYSENKILFYWSVIGKRKDIQIEPLKSEVELKGNGPYKWI